MSEEYVILVNEHDHPTGVMEKMDAHRKGALHRAVSVFVFNSKGEWLIHQRAAGKYHSSGLWTNTCCSHPRPGESVSDAAHRRLMEEMGMAGLLHHMFSFSYRAELDHNLVEHELDHIFTGLSDISPVPDPSEVSEWKYVSTDALRSMIASQPETFTVWFRLLFEKVAAATGS